jgi:hypothetical protein
MIPTVFGYHELFHALVLIAVALHSSSIAFCSYRDMSDGSAAIPCGSE